MGLQPEDMVQILDEIDLARATRDQTTGLRSLVLRCRVPVVLDAPVGSWRFEARPARQAAQLSADAGSELPGQRAAPEVMDRIKGPASSTSQDWYGTRMVKDCLESMATQFRAGVDYMPRHHTWSRAVEWNEVIGRTVEAEVIRATIANPPEGESATGDQFVLNVSTDLFEGEELATKLVDRIRAGRPPGQSIGGWFTSLQVTYDEDGYVQYPINVLDIELDHLAAVRSPANPDSDKVWLELSRRLEGAGRSTPEASPAPAPVSPEPMATLSAPVPIPDSDSGSGGIAPAPPPVPDGRAAEDDMPINEEDLAKFQDMLRGVVAPIQAELNELKARTAAPPTPAQPPAAPAPAVPSAEAELAALRSRNAALEAQVAAGLPQRAGSQPTAPAPAPSQDGIPEMWRVGTADARTIAPVSCAVVRQSGGEIPLSPALVFQHDGLGAVRSLGKALGEIRAVDAYLDGCPLKIGAEAALEVGGALRTKDVSPEILRSVLKNLCYAADQDRLLDTIVSVA